LAVLRLITSKPQFDLVIRIRSPVGRVLAAA
jgi:hypothetical protein